MKGIKKWRGEETRGEKVIASMIDSLRVTFDAMLSMKKGGRSGQGTLSRLRESEKMDEKHGK
jgi:hypothetical protein